MSQSSCFVCHSPLTQQSRQFARCTNESCPEGTLFVHCGYCKQFSVTVGADNKGPLICRNPRCKMHGLPRTVCPSCQKYSLSEVGSAKICISRSCPSNQSILRTCHFCNNAAFLQSRETNFCTKGDCEYLLVRMERCGACAKMTLDVGASKCRNRDCKRFNHLVETCPTCGQLSQVDGMCENADCTSNAGGSGHFQETLMGDILGELRDVLPAMGGGTDERARPRPIKPPPANDLTGSWEQPEWDGGLGTGMPPKPTAQPAAAGARPKKNRKATLNDFSPFDMLPEAPRGPDGAPLDLFTQAKPGSSEPVETGRTADVIKTVGPSLFSGPKETDAGFPRFPQSEPKPAPPPADLFKAPGPAPAPAPALFGQPAAPPPAPTPAPTPAPLPAPTGSSLFPPRKKPSIEPPSKPAPQLDLFGSSRRTRRAPRRGPAPKLFGQSSQPGADRFSLDTDESKALPAARDTDAVFPVPAIGQEPTNPKEVGFAEAYEFVLKHILTGSDGKTSPLLLVIGLSGAGKTTFLTVLGDILAFRKSKYYFPWEGLEVRRIDVDAVLSRGFEFRQTPEPVRKKLREQYKGHVKDLVFEYSQEYFSKYLGREHWAPPTAKGETYFLATELEHRQRSLAKIVTLETAGEDWKSLLYSLAGRRMSGADEKRLSTLRQLLNTAEGLIVLLDPADDKTDDIYQNFFLILKEAVGPRARNKARELIRERLHGGEEPAEVQRRAGPLDFRNLQGSLKQQLEDQLRKQREKEAFRTELRTKIQNTARRLELRGIEGLPREDTEFIQQLKTLFYRLDPKNVEQAERYLEDHNYSKDALIKFSRQMLSRAEKILEKLVELRFEGSGGGLSESQLTEEEQRVRTAWQEICRERKLGDNPRVDVRADNLYHNEAISDFPCLKNVAIVVTKTDMYPIVYPPERYPEVKLPKSKQHIGPLATYLKLLDGGICYYNSSATGYSVTRNGRPLPGMENTLCPINIIEPIMDMLEMPE